MLPSLSRQRCTAKVRRPARTNGSFAAIDPAWPASAARSTVTPEPGPVPGPDSSGPDRNRTPSRSRPSSQPMWSPAQASMSAWLVPAAGVDRISQ